MATFTEQMLALAHKHAKQAPPASLDPKVEALVNELIGRVADKWTMLILDLLAVHPVVPPKVEYRLTDLGLSLGAAFCGVWIWAAENLNRIEKSRRAFDAKAAKVTSAA